MIIRAMKNFRFHLIFVLVFLATTVAWSGAEKTYRLEADNKPLDEFLKEVAKITGKNFLLDPAVKGTVSFVSPKPLTKEEVWDLAKSALDINGFTVVEHQAIVKVIPKEAAAHHPVPTLGPTQVPMVVEGFVTALIPLNYITPEQAIDSVRILVGPHGKIASSPGKPGVVIIDTEANIARIRKLISRFDVKSARLQVDVIHLKWVNASEVAQVLTELFLKTGGVKGIGSASRFTSEERSNSIIIRAPFIDGKAAKELALKLDQQDSGITVRKLRDMDAESARQLLGSLIR